MFVSDPELRIPLEAFLSAVEASERQGTRCPFYLGKVPGPSPPWVSAWRADVMAVCGLMLRRRGSQSALTPQACSPIQVPLREQLPELNDDITRAPCNPILDLSSCFGPLVPAGVFTYFGCNRNVTPTHFDQLENLLICVYGTKRLWLYPPSDAPFLYSPPGTCMQRNPSGPLTSSRACLETQACVQTCTFHSILLRGAVGQP